jgi:hypothetical protein
MIGYQYECWFTQGVPMCGIYAWKAPWHMDFIVFTCFNMFLHEVKALYLRYYVLNSLDPQGGRVGSL